MKKFEVINTKYLMLEVEDQQRNSEKQEDKRDEVLALIAANPQKKVQEKCVRLFAWMQNGGTLNKVLSMSIRLLMTEGYLVFGVNGNLHKYLLNEYTVDTSGAQANQMSSMLPMLKIVCRDKDGKYLPNPDSLLLMRLNAELGLPLR